MSLTITRNTNGDVDIISTAGELPLSQYNVPNGTAGVSTDPSYANSVVITSPSLPTGKLSIALSKITTINGSAPPGTISAAITLLGGSVFFRKAPVGGGGTVTSASVVTANGISGTVATATTTPAITLTLGAITPTSTNGVSAATMAFMDATSSVQTQLNSLAPIASPVFTGGVALSGNISKAANFGTTGLVFSAPAITVTSTTSTGTIANQGSYAFGIPTLAASSATTLTNASTVYIDGAPAAGTNVTISNTYSLYINGGQSFFGSLITANGGIGTTATPAGANFYATSGNGSGTTTGSLLLFGGATTVNYRATTGGNSSNVIGVGNSSGNLIIGSAPLTKAASGTHAWLANLVVNPLGTVGAGSATVTNTAALYVGAASTAGTNNYGIFSVGNIFSQAAVIGTSVRGTAVTFASLPSPAVEGMLVPVTDSSTGTWGATITGGGANHILAYYNGTNWVVN